MALLAFLAAATPRGFHRRDKLLALFWPESDAPHARAALSQALHVVRAALGEHAIIAQGDDELALNADVIQCDVALFEAALDAGRPAEALALFRGELLDGFFVPGAPEFEHWLDRERSRLRHRASEGCWALADSMAATGRVVDAERWAKQAADLLPADEAVVRRLMRFLHGLGDRAAAVRAYELFVSALEAEYELEPSTETRALATTIRQGGLLSSELALPKSRLTESDNGSIGRAVAGIAGEVQSNVAPGAGQNGWRRRVVRSAIPLLAVASIVCYGIVARSGGEAGARSRTPRVLVLPFQNLGSSEDAYFAEGITDEITARLAMVKGLKVVGGQAALRYKDSRKTPRQIAEDIGVDYVLEGTVSLQRSAGGPGHVRVRPRLVDTRDDTPVWAAVLDEEMHGMKDLFAMLSGIGQRVAEELDVAIETPALRKLGSMPTTSLEAYDYYLRGRDLNRRTWTESNLRAAIQMFEQAVARDSNFADAYAWLSYAHTDALWLAALGADHLEQARQAAERALRLDPELPQGHLALGHYYYVCCEDYNRALEHFEKSRAARPGDARVVMLIGNVHKRQGRWDDARRYYERAASLDPQWGAPLVNLTQLQLWLRQYDDAERTIQRALYVNPQEAWLYTFRAWISLLRDGDTTGARQAVLAAKRSSDGFTGTRLPFYLALLDRDYLAALALVNGEQRASNFAGDLDEGLPSDHVRRGLALRLLGDSAAAWAQCDSARIELEERLRFAPRGSRRAQAWLRSGLAVSYAALGRRRASIQLANEVLAQDPVAIDALDGTLVLQNVALAYTLAGDTTAALGTIERLLTIPSRFSLQLVRLDPLWDPLRGESRFKRLAAKRPGDLGEVADRRKSR